RRGRAGRVQPGECYHLYPKCVYEAFSEYQLPELLRTPLNSLCLQIKSLQVESIGEFLSSALQAPEPRTGNRWIESPSQIREAVENYFENHFKSITTIRPNLDGIPFPSLSLEENQDLTAPFSLEEIHLVVRESDGNKSPGPDGFNFAFIVPVETLIVPVGGGYFKSIIGLAGNVIGPVLAPYKARIFSSIWDSPALSKEPSYCILFPSLVMPYTLIEVQNAIDFLTMIGALDEKENLTNLGKFLSILPVDPKLGKMLIMGAIFRCFDPVLTIVAGLSVRDPFLLPQDKRELAGTAKSRFSAKDYSDHMALVRAYEGWKDAEREGSAYEYCWRNFLSAQTLQAIHSLRKQFSFILKEAGLVDTDSSINNKLSHNQSLVRAVICSGLFPGIASVVGDIHVI
ncbi:ATP-dependent RNA helicase DHX36-like protein, partial [Trifolium pratense]